ncbi:MAG: hypothetical protein ACI977_000265 [Candidatus Nanohaloarchaea archaeon]|jgi:hypothetical protein
MHPAFKILIGALMVILGFYSIIEFSAELLTVIKGSIGVLLVLVGAFIVWLESDEWKLRKTENSKRQQIQQQFQPGESKSETSSETEEQGQEDIQQAVEGSSETESEKFACPDCGREFDTSRGMKIHQAQKH